ncbi:two-component system response regulator [Methyloprofundus sedimenti]|uniref:Two-component system response regulator n=1 Tax=Methyloprofundus sedimenti TaxID=1420851 RepID=A0A1V8M4S9_9GAMM|nr:response regulator transcription factor [Methyloprofundus sedimenti]OQK16570.1 two-component system response regulator [Methyloprofundus sedimenti]
MSPKILVIDDEPQIRRMLRIALKSDGYDVIDTESGEKGLALLARQQPDLVVLDLGLPDMDGHQVLAQLRGWSTTPVIVLSVRSSEKEKVMALDFGAQDYVTKPFSIEEFLARVRANIRDHHRPIAFSILDDGYLQIDLTKRLVAVRGHKIDLTPKEYAVLSLLAKAPNCVITQTHLLKEIWGPSHLENTHYLRIIVSHLRQKIGDDPSEPKYIKTEAGVGYRLVFNEHSQ